MMSNIDIITFEKNIIESKIVSCNNQMDKYSNSSLDTLYLKDLSIHEKNINQSLLDFLNGNYDLNIENEIKILEKLKKEYINVEIFTLYIIDLGHSKTHNFTEYDYAIITEGLDGWNIINVENKTKRQFKKRVNKGEFYWNFEYFYSILEDNNDFDFYNFSGSRHITITKIEKENDLLVFKTKSNYNPNDVQVSFLEYFLGFKRHLNPVKY